MSSEAGLDRLQAWRVPDPDPARASQLTEHLYAFVRSQPTSPTTEIGPIEQLSTLLRIARLQVSIMRPAFWLSAAVVVVLGAILVLLRPDAQRSLLVYLLGPLAGYCAVATAFSSPGLGLLECELACPPTPRQLVVARLAVVLAYTSALGVGLSIVMRWSLAGELILTWLAPLVVEVGGTLLLSVRLQTERAATIVYALWATLLATAWALGIAPVAPAQAVNVLLFLAGLCAIGVAIYAVPHQFDRRVERAVL